MAPNTSRLQHDNQMTAPSDSQLIDISVQMAVTTPEWPGDTPFTCGWIARRVDGSSVNLGEFTTSPHVGTHADAPLHVEDGWGASESLPVAAFVGAARVLDVQAWAGEISATQLEVLLGGNVPTRLLMVTGRSIVTGAFPEQWATLSVEAAQWLMQRGTILVGTDAPSVDERSSQTLPVHHALFGGGAYVLENLALRDVASGEYELLAAPLAVAGLDAAPVRALLRNLRDL